MKLITIIIPVYNMDKYLPECLNSVLNQTLLDIEVLCIDDGSIDNSSDILAEYKEKDCRIRIINQKNQGVSAARNAGIKAASAEYVCFMDPDDCYPDEMVLTDLYNGAKENSMEICGGSFSHLEEPSKKLVTTFEGSLKKYMFTENKVMQYENYQFDYGYHRFIYSRKMLQSNEIYFPPLIRYQDPPFFVQAMIAAGSFFALSRISYQYRIGHQNIQWDEPRLIALMMGICSNLRISSQLQLADLHAITIQRIIEHQEGIRSISLSSASAIYRRCLFNIIFDINYDLLMKSKFGINIDELFLVLDGYNSEMAQSKDERFREEINLLKNEMESWKFQYECIFNSKTFLLGKYVLYIPKKIFFLIKKLMFAD